MFVRKLDYTNILSSTVERDIPPNQRVLRLHLVRDIYILLTATYNNFINILFQIVSGLVTPFLILRTTKVENMLIPARIMNYVSQMLGLVKLTQWNVTPLIWAFGRP